MGAERGAGVTKIGLSSAERQIGRSRSSESLRHDAYGQLDGLCFLVAYQLNSLFMFMMLFLFNVQLRNKYDDDALVLLVSLSCCLCPRILNSCLIFLKLYTYLWLGFYDDVVCK